MADRRQRNNNPNTSKSTAFPFFVKAGALVRSGTKALVDSINGTGFGFGGGISGNAGGVFSSYRGGAASLNNIPLSRFRTTQDFLGAYANISDVYTCVNTVANAIAGLPTEFIDDTGKTIATLGQQEALPGTLAYLLDNPNPYQSWYELKETISAHLDLCGNSLLLKDNMDGAGRPESLYPLNPSFIRLIVDGKDGLLGYVYQPGDIASRVIYDPEEIIHIKTSNPRSILWGQGRLEALAAHLDVDIDVTDSLRALYKNGAVIPGAFVQKDIMTDQQYKRLKAELNQEYTGVANFYRPLVLDGGLDWKQMSVSHTDLGTFELKKLNREQIYMAFGVPLSQAGNQGAANVKNDHLTEIFWTTSIQPRTVRIEAAFKPLCRIYDNRCSIRLPLPVQVAEGEILDNAMKADKLESLSNSEKRTIIKALLGTRFGLEDMPAEKPVEAADEVPVPANIRETIAQQEDPNLPAIGEPNPNKPTQPTKPNQGQGQGAKKPSGSKPAQNKPPTGTATTTTSTDGTKPNMNQTQNQ